MLNQGGAFLLDGYEEVHWDFFLVGLAPDFITTSDGNKQAAWHRARSQVCFMKIYKYKVCRIWEKDIPINIVCELGRIQSWCKELKVFEIEVAEEELDKAGEKFW